MTESNLYYTVATAKCPLEYCDVLNHIASGHYGVVSEATIIKLLTSLSKRTECDDNYLRYAFSVIQYLVGSVNKSVKLANSTWIQNLCLTHICSERRDSQICVIEEAADILAELHSYDSQHVWCSKLLQYVNACRWLVIEQLGCVSRTPCTSSTLPSLHILRQQLDSMVLDSDFGVAKAVRVCRALEAYTLVIRKVCCSTCMC